jgi:hypothetical protein
VAEGLERIEGRVEIAPYAAGSKSARQHQPFLVTATGERLMLRRYDGPPMRDSVLEKMDGKDVIAEGERRDNLFIAWEIRAAKAPARDAR